MRIGPPHQVRGTVGRHRVLEEEPPGHVEEAEHVTSPPRPVAPSSVSRWTARRYAERCESMAPFDTPVDPLVRNTALVSSLAPTRGGAIGDAASLQPGAVTSTGSPSGCATARATSSNSGCTTTSRGRSVSSAERASGSVKLGLIGAIAAPSLLVPYATSSASNAVGPHHTTRSSCTTSSAASRCAARFAPVSSCRKVRASSPSVAPTRCGVTCAHRARMSWTRTSIVTTRAAGAPRAGTSGSSARVGTRRPGRSGRPIRSGTW